MKSLKLLTTSLILLMLSQFTLAQNGTKRLKMEKVLDLSADKVWTVLKDYGYIANSHPKIVDSEYLGEHIEAAEGCERICYFNESGSRFVKEKMLNYNPDNMSYTNQVYAAGRFPVDPEKTSADYSVIDLGNGKSKLVFDMQFRTKPAFMGGLMKGNFRRLIEDYFLSIEHYAKTGEAVTVENFKAIKKQYRS